MTKNNEQFCPNCGHVMRKDGFTPTGRQRYECPDCGKKSSVPRHVSVGGLPGFLRQIRENKFMTQQEVANQLDHTRGWLSRLESGTTKITVDDLFLLAKIYQMRVSEILLEYEKLLYP